MKLFEERQKQNNTKAIALKFNVYINSRDVEKLAELMTNDHVFIDMENNRIEGAHDNINIAWKPFFNLFPDYQNVFERVVVKDNRAIMEGYSVCSDKRFNNLRAIWVAEVRDDKISLWRIYPNTKENKTFLGI
ncbi:MAG: nuclear transport factor 2 family protein [Planctomycetaceae bacterium]|jgi:hypothetical protein|nr:nuclear transport factor 2 family protein [Planctomycetaceae bacterium]